MHTAVRLLALPLTIGSLSLATLSPVQAASSTFHTTKLSTPGADFWTPERMRVAEAHPRDLPTGPGGSGATRAKQKPVKPITRAQVVKAHGRAPVKMVGKLYIVGQNNDLYTCSGTVVNTSYTKKGKGNKSVILTAGHCVEDPKDGFSSKAMRFKPDYADGKSPRGLWDIEWTWTYRNWSSQRNWAYDYAMLVSTKHRNGPVAKFTGAQSMQFNYKKRNYWVRAYGYPAEYTPNNTQYADKGEKLRMCKGRTRGVNRGGLKSLALSCNMSHGASGGPLIASLKKNGYGRIISLVSFGIGKQTVINGPIFNTATRNLYFRARTQKSSTVDAPQGN
ncbi:MAG: trypsin-like peptidase domain-containing protein [Streptosporangiaceae bacterium]